MIRKIFSRQTLIIFLSLLLLICWLWARYFLTSTPELPEVSEEEIKPLNSELNLEVLEKMKENLIEEEIISKLPH